MYIIGILYESIIIYRIATYNHQLQPRPLLCNLSRASSEPPFPGGGSNPRGIRAKSVDPKQKKCI